jgi:pimeloyl-ACP methyl ester carboxylesterase
VKDTWHYESLMATMHAGFAKQGSEGILRARAIEDRLMAQTWELAGYDLLARLGAVNIPTLLVNGDHDFIPAEISMHIAAAMPNAELVTLRDCGHFAFLERGAELREVIDDFFSAKRPVIRAVHNEGAAGPEA